MKKYSAALAVIIILIFTVMSSAEESAPKKNFGITASASPDYSTAGFIYNFSDYAAFRPVIGFYQVDNSVKEYSALADFLFFSKQVNNFSIYGGAGFGMSYRYQSYKYADGDVSKSRSTGYTGSILIGGQYMFTERFGFFADTGIQAGRWSSKNEYNDSVTGYSAVNETNIIVRLRSASIGALFYLF